MLALYLFEHWSFHVTCLLMIYWLITRRIYQVFESLLCSPVGLVWEMHVGAQYDLCYGAHPTRQGCNQKRDNSEGVTGDTKFWVVSHYMLCTLGDCRLDDTLEIHSNALTQDAQSVEDWTWFLLYYFNIFLLYYFLDYYNYNIWLECLHINHASHKGRFIVYIFIYIKQQLEFMWLT